MLRNYLTTALRNLVRNRLYAAINILGLAAGLTAACLIALFLRDEFSYDAWIPGHESVYLLTETLAVEGRTPAEWHRVPLELAEPLKLDFPQLQAVTRLSAATVSIRRGAFETRETLYWADPDIFDVLRLPVAAGNLADALRQPDGLVLTRRMAEKFFGSADAIGKVLEIDREHPMRVTAVLEDLPSNTHLNAEIFGSGLASYSVYGLRKTNPLPSVAWVDGGYTYVRLGPGAAPAGIEAALPQFLDRHMRERINRFTLVLHLTPLTQIHMRADNGTTAMKPVADPRADYALAVIGALILAVAGINFVNLMTARAARRAVEVGVRKTSGAIRADLVIQFVGEALVYVAAAALLAASAGMILWAPFNAFLERRIAFDGAASLGWFAITAVVIGIFAGLYPALLLSGLRPADALKNRAYGSKGTLRKVLVVAQFAILIALMTGVAVIYRQSSFALTENLRFNTDQMVLVETRCKTAFAQRIGGIPGVNGAACAQMNGLDLSRGGGPYAREGAEPVEVAVFNVDEGYFELFGLKPLAGRFFSRAIPADAVLADFTHPEATRPTVIINATAARLYGFATPAEAIGQTIFAAFTAKGMGFHGPTVEIVGVVPDFTLDSVYNRLAPAIYFANSANFRWLTLKLSGEQIPETLAAIDALWKESGEPHPIHRLFLNQEVANLYRNIGRQSQVFGAFTAIAVLIAMLGLFGLAAFAAETRTKEIGVRKALGASRPDILRLLLWEFATPVLWANVIAWPAAYLVMHRWLESFAYHVELAPGFFLAASGAALVIALATVVGHALIVARAEPVRALRYE